MESISLLVDELIIVISVVIAQEEVVAAEVAATRMFNGKLTTLSKFYL